MSRRMRAMKLLAAGALMIGSAAGGALPASAAPALNCAYESVCGQGANGHSFSFAKCNQVEQLPGLVGSGPLNNNQTPGTRADFYDHDGNLLFSSTAPEQRTVDWTPVWYVRACTS